MASIDLNLDYKEAQKKIEASKAYKDLKSQYDDRTKRAGESFDQKKEDLTKSLVLFVTHLKLVDLRNVT